MKYDDIEGNYDLFRGGETNIKIGDLIYDSRNDCWIEITEEKQIYNYSYVAPELYCVAKPKKGE